MLTGVCLQGSLCEPAAGHRLLPAGLARVDSRTVPRGVFWGRAQLSRPLPRREGLATGCGGFRTGGRGPRTHPHSSPGGYLSTQDCLFGIFDCAVLSALRAEHFDSPLLFAERGMVRNLSDQLWRRATRTRRAIFLGRLGMRIRSCWIALEREFDGLHERGGLSLSDGSRGSVSVNQLVALQRRTQNELFAARDALDSPEGRIRESDPE